MGVLIGHFTGLEDVSPLTSVSKSLAWTMHAASRPLQNALAKFYVCGGWNNNKQSLDYVECFSFASGSWEALPPLLICRACPMAAVIAKRLYVCGGWVEEQASTAMEYYDSSVGRWQVATPMPTPRFSGIGASVAGCLYISGGWDGYHALRGAIQYDPYADSWQALPSMKKGRWFFAGSVLSSRIFTLVEDGMENTPCKQSNDLLQVSPTGKSYRLFLSRELALQQQLLITAYMYVEAGQTFMQHPY